MHSYRIYFMSLIILFYSQLVISGGNTDDLGKAEIASLVKDSLLAWETGNEKLFVDTAHPDLLFAFPGERTNASGALNVFRYWQEHYEQTKVYIHWVLVDGMRFSVEYQFATTKKSTGKRTSMGTVAIGEIRDGKIILLKEYTDGRVSRMQEAGELPLEEGLEPFPWPLTDRKHPWSEDGTGK